MLYIDGRSNLLPVISHQHVYSFPHWIHYLQTFSWRRCQCSISFMSGGQLTRYFAHSEPCNQFWVFHNFHSFHFLTPSMTWMLTSTWSTDYLQFHSQVSFLPSDLRQQGLLVCEPNNTRISVPCIHNPESGRVVWSCRSHHPTQWLSGQWVLGSLRTWKVHFHACMGRFLLKVNQHVLLVLQCVTVWHLYKHFDHTIHSSYVH